MTNRLQNVNASLQIQSYSPNANLGKQILFINLLTTSYDLPPLNNLPIALILVSNDNTIYTYMTFYVAGVRPYEIRIVDVNFTLSFASKI